MSHKVKRVQLKGLIGQSALNTKSEYVGINGFPLVSLQVKGSANITAGELTIKQVFDNTQTVGKDFATATADSTRFIASDSTVSNGTVCYVEITTALVGGVIEDATLVLSTR